MVCTHSCEFLKAMCPFIIMTKQNITLKEIPLGDQHLLNVCSSVNETCSLVFVKYYRFPIQILRKLFLTRYL